MIVSPGTAYRWLQELDEGPASGPLQGVMAQLEQLPCGAVEVPCRLRVGIVAEEWVQQVYIHKVL